MMSRYLKHLCLIVTICCLPTAAAAEVTAKLEIVPGRTLPGLQVPLRLTLENRGTSDVLLADRVVYQVRESNGTEYLAERQPAMPPHLPVEGTLFPDDEAEAFTLQPGEKRDIWMPTNGAVFNGPEDAPYSAAAVWLDNRVMLPGRRFLRLKVGGSPNTPWIVSNEAELTVEEPSGVDAVVWQRMQELWQADNHHLKKPYPWVPGWPEEVVKNHPESSYFAVAAMMVEFDLDHKEERVELLERALATTTTPSFVRDALIANIGGTFASISSDWMASNDLDRALEYAARARDVLGPIEKQSAYAWIRDGVESILAGRRTDQDLIDTFYTHHAITTATNAVRARPFVECIWPIGERSFIALYGYENLSDGGKYLPVGNGNRFRPGQADRRQPRWIKPGTEHQVAGAVSENGQPVEWQLDGNSAVATADFPTKCSGETRPVRPIVECANNDNEGVVVTFGYENPNPFPVRIEVGDANRFDGSSADRGQPTLFEAGRHRSVFKVKVKDAAVTWTLSGRAVTATPRHPVVCTSR